MATRGMQKLPAELAQAARWAKWRRTRELGTRIPEALLKLTLELAARYGMSKTAIGLQVDYYALKKRLGEQRPSSGRPGRGAGIRRVDASIVLYAVAASAARHDLDLWAYLRATLEHLARNDVRLTALLPDVWAKAHPEQIRTYRQHEREARAAAERSRRTRRRT